MWRAVQGRHYRHQCFSSHRANLLLNFTRPRVITFFSLFVIRRVNDSNCFTCLRFVSDRGKRNTYEGACKYIFLRLTFVRSAALKFARVTLFTPARSRQIHPKKPFYDNLCIYWRSRIIVFGLRRDLRLARRGSTRWWGGGGVGERNKKCILRENEVQGMTGLLRPQICPRDRKRRKTGEKTENRKIENQ